MNKVFKYISSSLMVAAALTACSPETFDGPNQAGIPSVQDVDINLIVDQSVNQATFTVANMPAQTYAIWTVNGTLYSTLNPMNWANNKAGTYDVELRLGNRNGFSQGSISKSFTFENSQVDFTPYYNRIARTWRINYAEQGHMGCGEPGTDGSNWWSAAPNDKADWGVYDDRISFDENGVYTYDPGDGGTMYVNTGCSIFSEYNTGDGQDFMANVAAQTASYKFDVDGDKVVLILPSNTQFPYISSDGQFANPVFTVVKLTNSEMVLLYEGNGITWRFVFTSKEDEEGGEDEAKVDWDPAAASNLWAAVESGDAYKGLSTWFADNGWGTLPTQPEINHTAGVWEFTAPAGVGSNQWQGQVKIFTSLNASQAKKYNFYCVVESDMDIPGATIKLTQSDESEDKKHDDNFFFDGRHDIIADVPLVYKAEASVLPKGDAHELTLVFDFGGVPEGAHVKISKIYFEETTAMSYDDENNLWKSVDNGDTYKGITTWFADNGWGMLPTQPEIKHEGNKWSLTVPDGTGSSQWQGQVKIFTTLSAAQNDPYNFQCTLTADADITGATIKLTQSDESEDKKHDDNFYFDGRHNLTANEAFVYKAIGVTLPKGDAHEFTMVFDFGGAPAGTNITISEIIFEKAQ